MDLSKLTASPAQCKELQSLGINTPTFLSHYLKNTNGKAWEVVLTGTSSGYEVVPAWTKEELDAMIGPEFPKPDFWRPDKVGAQDPESYPVYFPETMKIFKRGAEASAAALIYLLKNKHVRAYDANERYNSLFIDVNNKG